MFEANPTYKDGLASASTCSRIRSLSITSFLAVETKKANPKWIGLISTRNSKNRFFRLICFPRSPFLDLTCFLDSGAVEIYLGFLEKHFCYLSPQGLRIFLRSKMKRIGISGELGFNGEKSPTELGNDLNYFKRPQKTF
jgi:hypothetical protein